MNEVTGMRDDEARLQWNYLAEKMQRRGQQRMAEDFVDLTPVSVDPEDGDFFVYVEVRGGTEKATLLEGYREGDRWLVAKNIEQLVESGATIQVIIGDTSEIELLDKCRELVNS